MGSRSKTFIVILCIYANALQVSGNSCVVEGIPNWPAPAIISNIQDVYMGDIFRASTSNIQSFTYTFSSALNDGPYINISHEDSVLVLETNEKYKLFEEYETLANIAVTLIFDCADGISRTLVFLIFVQDTNNNDPIFDSDENNAIEFLVKPPLAPGSVITNAVNEIRVRDIDLTTQRIDFEIVGESIFAIEEIEFNTAKEFRAELQTTAFIRNLPEPYEFTIKATDVDLTGDPRRTTYTTIRLKSDGEFDLPPELVFTQTFYMATYTADDEIILQDQISLYQGYDSEVQFKLPIIDEYTQYFDILPSGNNVVLTLRDDSSLPAEVLSQGTLFLVVRADREYTTGSSATIVLQLPEIANLLFENSIYEGRIVDDDLDLPPLILTQGYENQEVSLEIRNEYTTFFDYNIEGNIITILMLPLTTNIIEQNSFLNLEIVATTGHSSATTIVTLEIIKNDTVTPMFDRSLYSGSYNPENGLSMEQPITLTQGYEDSDIYLEGEYAELFEITGTGPTLALSVANIPTSLFAEGPLLISIYATKLRTVGANAAVSISLPAEIGLLFETSSYEGKIIDNVLDLPRLLLIQGYEDEQFSVEIRNDYNSFFSYSIQGNSITISMSPLDSIIIEQNSFLILEIVADTGRSSATTVVTLEIIKDDTVTPIFDSSLYIGSYDPENGLSMDQEITLTQGYEDIEIFLEGEYGELFEATPTGQSVTLSVADIPTNLYAEGSFLITIKATKPRTVGANAAIYISLPAEVGLLFERTNYEGKIVDNSLDILPLLLTQGYEDQNISLSIQNEYSSFFSYDIQENVITLTMSTLDSNIIEQNSFLVLEIVATTGRFSATTIVTLEIIKDDTVTPLFDRSLYSGSYDTDNGLSMEQQITFSQGHEDTEIYLEGEYEDLFEVNRTGVTVNLAVTNIPTSLFAEGPLLITIKATKPRTVGANAAIFISLPAEVELLFEKPNYEGKIVDNVLDLSELLFIQGYEDQDISLDIRNDHNSFFAYEIQGNVVTLTMSPLDTTIIEQNSFLNLEIVATTGRSSATTIVTLEIIKDDTVTPIFDSRLYSGSYDPENGLSMEQPITLTQGYEDTEVYLEGEHQDLFEVRRDGQSVILSVDSIPVSLFARGQLLITITATKPRTVGANAAVSIALPGAAEVELLFEKPNYEGKIVDNVLDLSELLFIQGYEDQDISLDIRNDHNSFFAYEIQGNVVTLTMSPLDTTIIEQNSFLNLEIVATTGRSSATTIVTLEIIKDDTVTPMFDSRLYSGSYDPENGLSMEQPITLTQGYEDTEIYLEGEHQDLFEVRRDGQSVILSVDSIPVSLFARGQLLITITATKPRTVGANAAVSIALPGAAEVELLFEKPNYEGKIVDNVLDLSELLFIQGYEDQDISLDIRNDHNSFFAYEIQGNVVTLTMSPLDTTIIEQNSFLNLEIVATTGRSSATTIVTLEIIKDDTVTPMFDSRLYSGSYDPENGLSMEQPITLTQGYEDTEVYLEGEHQDLFEVRRDGQSVILSVDSIPVSLFARGQLLITITATKPRTVGANAAVSIALPGAAEVELLFEKPNYEGKIVDNVLDLSELLFIQGYEDQDISLDIRNDHNSFFAYEIQGNVVTLTMSPLDTTIIEQNSFLNLEIVATTGRSSATTIVTLEIIKDDTVTPMFDSRLYSGSYDPENGLSMEQPITLTQGYEDTEVYLEGEHQDLFEVRRDGQSVILSVNSIPVSLFARGQLLITITATKPRTVGANAAVSIALPGAAEVELLFEKPNYEGKIVDNVLDLSELLFIQGYEDQDISLDIRNDHNSFFAYEIQGNVVTLTMSPLDTTIIEQNSFLNLEIVATTGRSSATTIVTLEIIKDDTVTPMFDSRLYSGSYDPENGLSMEQPITLTQGYENTEVYLEGEHQDLFEVRRDGQSVILSVNSIPVSLFARGQLLITITATKPRTVGANAAVSIALPGAAEVELLFEKPNYEGKIVDNVLDLSELLFIQGYEDQDISLDIRNDHNSFFAYEIQGNVVTLTMSPLDTTIIEQNSFLNLEIVATTGRSSATTIVTLEIIKDDTVTPMFDSRLYSGSYDPENGLSMEQPITLTQGYENTEVYLEGEHQDLFEVRRDGQSVILSVNSIPVSLFARGQLLITITATKPRTVGANAAVSIALPGAAEVELLFEKPNYEGKIVDNVLDLSELLFIQGYEDQDISLDIRNDHNSFFAYEIQGNVVTLTMSPLDTTIIEQNSFLNLEIVATTGRSSATTIVTLEIIKDDTVTPMFDSRLYSGSYDPENGLSMEQPITLTQGYENTEVYLEGEHQDLFEVRRDGQSVILSVNSIPVSLFARGQLLITITATKPRTVGANAAVSIALPGAAEVELLFEKPNYEGKIVDNVLDLSELLFIQGYEDQDISLDIRNDHNSFFAYEIQGNVVTLTMSPLDTTIIEQNSFLNLEIVATTGRSSATTIVTLEIIKDDTVTPMFDSRLYSGSYDPENGLSMEQPITLTQGYEDTEVYLEGEHQDLFEVRRDGQSVILSVDSIPVSLFARGQLLITITATKPRTVGANAAVSIALPGAAEVELLFEKPNYEGKIVDNVLDLSELLFIQGYEDQDISLDIRNDHNSFFAYEIQGNVVTLTMSPLDTTIIEQNSFLNLEIVATTGRSSATTIVTLEIIKDDTVTPMFDSRLYSASYDPENGLSMEQPITLTQGYENTEVYLEGEHQDLFEVRRDGQSVILSVDSIPVSLFARGQLLITITATKPRTVGANAAVSIALPGAAEVELLFEKPNYEGKIVDNVLDLSELLFIQGYEDQDISLDIRNDHNSFFAYEIQGNVVTLTMSPLDTTIIEQNSFLNLEIVATTGRSSATTIVTLEIIKDDTVTPMFDSRLYSGSYDPENGLSMEQPITLTQGYEDIEIILEGEHQNLFEADRIEQFVTISVHDIPTSLFPEGPLLLIMKATKPRTVGANTAISIALPADIETSPTVIFNKVLYQGIIEGGILQHETIILNGYDGTDIEIRGAFNTSFRAIYTEGIVVVDTVGTPILPPNTQHLALELRADNAGAVLLVEVSDAEDSVRPIVTFSAPSYVIRAESSQFGVISRVQATSDNGEPITYSLRIDNEHLLTRLSITDDGELRLTAPADYGAYYFQVLATTIITQAQGEAPVSLTVEALVTCGDNETVTTPLVVIDRNEEEPHRNLVVLDSTQHTGCRYSMTNRWPTNQQWLYVDDTGLHAYAIDREDPSIAFMSLSQIQVELTLECETDPTRTKRSIDSRYDYLGPYDYGSNTWIIADTIEYNPRKTIVNLIVNDINDNSPIFIGKENEPIVVGYPVSELQSTILPRSLIELQATDADVGENAAIVYWSSESQLAVSSTTGFVHMKNDAELSDNMEFVVSATDLNGQGLTGTISLRVKLLNISNIAVISVRDSFLEDESRILSNISSTIGYEVKALRSAVVLHSDDLSLETRKKRDVQGAAGGILEIYLYGLLQGEPVPVNTLTTDIYDSSSNIPIDVSRILALEEYMEIYRLPRESENNVGLLVSTVILSVLLFILLVGGAVWFYIKRRPIATYEAHKDEVSISSGNESVKEEDKTENLARPRLNKEELKRSEKRLQEMLNTPTVEVTVEPTTAAINSETAISMPDMMAPIVIQDKLKDAEDSDDDEFGERKKNRRKSVVTFNENVERIIHVENVQDDTENEDSEIYKL